ncbi:collagen alpha-1(I) chain-like [Agelaius tricolor]|uniref:collagen alpha-1(I) chain-like n=1 Tax=Agelaius tricolor TaxID=9191 RepID=UPI0039F237F2
MGARPARPCPGEPRPARPGPGATGRPRGAERGRTEPNRDRREPNRDRTRPSRNAAGPNGADPGPNGAKPGPSGAERSRTGTQRSQAEPNRDPAEPNGTERDRTGTERGRAVPDGTEAVRSGSEQFGAARPRFGPARSGSRAGAGDAAAPGAAAAAAAEPGAGAGRGVPPVSPRCPRALRQPLPTLRPHFPFCASVSLFFPFSPSLCLSFPFFPSLSLPVPQFPPHSPHCASVSPFPPHCPSAVPRPGALSPLASPAPLQRETEAGPPCPHSFPLSGAPTDEATAPLAEGTPPVPGTPRVTPPVSGAPPEPPGDIIPLYCALLAGLVVGLVAYVAFKCWDTCRKKRQLDKARDTGDAAVAADAEKQRGDSGVCPDSAGLEPPQPPPHEGPSPLPGSPRRQEEPGELERLLELGAPGSDRRGPGPAGTPGDITSAV